MGALSDIGYILRNTKTIPLFSCEERFLHNVVVVLAEAVIDAKVFNERRTQMTVHHAAARFSQFAEGKSVEGGATSQP